MDIDVDFVARSCLGYRARKAALNVTRIFNAALREVELTITQFLLLVAIARNAARTQDAYAAALGLERTTFLRNLKLIIGQGWAERTMDGGQPYRLTEAGTAMIARALPHWAVAHETITAAIGAGHLAATYDSLRRLAHIAAQPITSSSHAP